MAIDYGMQSKRETRVYFKKSASKLDELKQKSVETKHALDIGKG